MNVDVSSHKFNERGASGVGIIIVQHTFKPHTCRVFSVPLRVHLPDRFWPCVERGAWTQTGRPSWVTGFQGRGMAPLTLSFRMEPWYALRIATQE